MRELVPAAPPSLPDAAAVGPVAGFTALDIPITTSLPFTVSLDATWRVTLLVPTGLATTWRSIEPRWSTGQNSVG